MNGQRRLVFLGALSFVLLVGGCQRSQTPAPTPTDVELGGVAYDVRGPVVHQNLAVFFLCAAYEDKRDFLTLDEGLNEGLVKITEEERESVGSLQIDNQSDRPLYLQEGERLQGGKQDRTILASLVVPPRSGKTSVPTMCVEASRWIEGEKGKALEFTANAALAPKAVRGAAKVDGSQQDVWVSVAKQKISAADLYNVTSRTSSVNELLDAPQVRKLSDEYANALTAPRDNSDEQHAVGMAIVLNGQIEEVNVYPNHALFSKMYPRLVQSYALQAALLKDQPAAEKPMTASIVAQYLKTGGEKSKQEKSLDGHNKLNVVELVDNSYSCTTEYDGKRVHWQMMKRNGKADAAMGKGKAAEKRASILGGDW